MQTQSQKKVYKPPQKLLECRLCTDIFKKPITLTCGHTFCYYCLYKFMKQHSDLKSSRKIPSKVNKKLQQQVQSYKKQQQLKHEQQLQSNIPVPLCPSCCSMIWKYKIPIKNFKQNLTIANLITQCKYKPQLSFDNAQYDKEIQNFDHRILIQIEKPKIQPMPYCLSEIRFTTCFLDDISEQSHSQFIVIQWPKFKKNVGLAGKILRAEVEYHSKNKGKQCTYRALFSGLFFVKISKRKTLEINLKSRYYTQASFYADNQQFAFLQICKCQQYHSQNIQPLQSFHQFLTCYDTLNNPHYLNQIYKILEPKPFYDRNNPQAMIYCAIRLLRFKNQERKQLIECFDDEFRIKKINQFIIRNSHLPIEELMYVSIPGKYNSAFVFLVIAVLIFLHYMQSS